MDGDYIDRQDERLNAFCKGRTIDQIDVLGLSQDIVIRFSDGSVARISTAGGVEIEELMYPTRTVRIPTCAEHIGSLLMTITVPWSCLVCGGPRGEPVEEIGFFGGRRMQCHGWRNPCGHIEKYSMVRASLGVGA